MKETRRWREGVRWHRRGGVVTALVLLCVVDGLAIDPDSCCRMAALPPDTLPVPMPKPRTRNEIAHMIVETANAYLLYPFDLALQLRRLNDHRIEAMNIDRRGNVPNSSWYTNRNVAAPMPLAQVARGPNHTVGPDTSGYWWVFRAKDEGLSPGFSIRDRRGHRFVIKFDPRQNPELSSGAEIISSRILYAAGYWVPRNSIVVFDTAKVLLDSGVTYVTPRGVKRTMCREDLALMFSNVPMRADGRVRALASRYIEGEPLGGWNFRGTRGDDPNDFIPHEHRRELRGLRVIAAWINHFDLKAVNTFATYIPSGNEGHVRHYLIDFGSTLGSSTKGAMWKSYGHENAFDIPRILQRVVSLGFYQPSYWGWDTIPSPSVGAWEARTFRPQAFRFGVPNLAFTLMTAADAYWGARVVMSFSDAQIDTIVAQARYSDTADAAFVARVLKRRRDIIGRYYFERSRPLDHFRMSDSAAGGAVLSFDDMGIREGLWTEAVTHYRYTVTMVPGKKRAPVRTHRTTAASLPLALALSQKSDERCMRVAIRVFRAGGEAARPVRVFLRTSPGDEPTIVRVAR